MSKLDKVLEDVRIALLADDLTKARDILSLYTKEIETEADLAAVIRENKKNNHELKNHH